MQRKVNITPNQKVTTEDFNNLGSFPRASFDVLHRDAIDHTVKYAGFPAVQAAPAEVSVGSGRMYKNGEVFFRSDEGGVAIDMLSNLPAVAKRIAIIVAYGNLVDTDLQTRSILTDAATRQIEGQEIATESRRVAYLDAVYGQENATPVAPAIASDFVAVAEVVLTPAGIESIRPLTANQLPSVRKNKEAITVINNRLTAIGPELDTAKSNIAALGDAVRGKADVRFVMDLAFDLADVKEQVDLPDDYTAWGTDHFLTADEVDSDHSDFSAKILEGGRYPYAATASLAVTLNNPLDSKVTVHGNMAVPKFSEQKLFSVRGRDGEYSLSDTTVETTEIRELTRTRTVIRYHESQRICTNAQFWQSGRYDEQAGIFRRGGETFEVENTTGNIYQGGGRHGLTHVVRVRKFTEVDIQEPFFDRVVTTETVSGSIVGQTLLQGSDGYLSSINLFFTRKAVAGEVQVLICETRAGAFDLSRTIARKTIAVADIASDPNGETATSVAFGALPLLKGRRYSLVVLSAGAHFLATVSGNKLASGAIFYVQDGEVVAGDPSVDLAFEAFFAEFESPIIQVELAPLSLGGGIDMIDINADTTTYDGTRLEFQVLVAGVWRSLSEDDAILASRPEFARLRAVFIGTKDIMPALGLTAARSNIELSRPSLDRTLISIARTMPAAVTTVTVRVRYENWDGDHNTSAVTLLHGAGFATELTAAAAVDSVPRDDPNALVRELSFTVPDITSFKIKEVGETDNSLFADHVARLGYVAFA
jgi:hypothetical protein